MLSALGLSRQVLSSRYGLDLAIHLLSSLFTLLLSFQCSFANVCPLLAHIWEAWGALSDTQFWQNSLPD